VQAPAVKPNRLPFQLIPAISHDENRGTRQVGGFIGYINGGDWLRYDRFDFGAAGGARGAAFSAVVACPDQYAGHTIQVRADRVDGPLLGVLKVKSTGGFGNWQPQSVPLTASAVPAGIHDVFLVFSGGGWNLDKIKLTLSARSGTDPILGVSFNEAKGVQTRGGVLCDTEDGHWARYDGLDFDSGVNAVAITFSCDGAHPGGKIALRLDRIDGPLLAELPVESTRSWGRFVTRLLAIDTVAGSHNVFLTFSGQGRGLANVSRFQFFPPTNAQVLPAGKDVGVAPVFGATDLSVPNGGAAGGERPTSGVWGRMLRGFGPASSRPASRAATRSGE
jgi:hypothetical protein